MPHIRSAIFDCSAPDIDSCPEVTVPEFAFIGRSNVGKSSLLNMLTGDKGLAKVSKTPGHTRLINFFTINRAWRLVDLPGYGFAKGSKRESFRFNRAVANYLEKREALAGIFALIDCGLPPQKIDLEFIDWLISKSVPFVFVFTKIDKVKPSHAKANIEAFTSKVGEWLEELPAVFTSSAETGQGRNDLLSMIEDAISGPETGESNESPETDVAVAPRPVESGTQQPNVKKKKRSKPKRPNRNRPW